MEPVTTIAIGGIVAYFAKKIKDNPSVNDFLNEFTAATVDWIRPIFLRDDETEKDIIADLKKNPDSESRQDAIKSAIKIAIEDNPDVKKDIESMWQTIQKKDKTIQDGQFSIDNRGAKIGQQNIGSTVKNEGDINVN